MKKKFLIRLGITVALAVFLEIWVFNFEYWMEKVDTSTRKNIVYNVNQMEKVNWTKTSQGWVSEGDQHLIIKDLNTRINIIQINMQVEQKPDYILLFYTGDEVGKFNNDASILCGSETVKVNKNIKDLRLDISNRKGILLKDITLIINPMSFNFSFARVIAIILIYIFGYGLFALQRRPDYGVEGKKQDES